MPNGRAGPVGRRGFLQKRRQFTPAFKARIVLDVRTGVQSQAQAGRTHGLSPTLLALGKATFLERAPTVFARDASRTAEQARIAARQQVLGRITLENEILKKCRAGWPLQF